MAISEYTVEVLMHCFLITLFISIFFFYYGTYIEENTVSNQLGGIVNDVVMDIRTINPNIIDYVKPYINNMIMPDLKSADDQVAANNKSVIINTIIAITIFSIILLVIIVIIVHKNKLSWKKIIAENSISLIFIGLTYFMFTTFIIGDFKSIDKNYFMRCLIESIQS